MYQNETSGVDPNIATFTCGLPERALITGLVYKQAEIYKQRSSLFHLLHLRSLGRQLERNQAEIHHFHPDRCMFIKFNASYFVLSLIYVVAFSL